MHAPDAFLETRAEVLTAAIQARSFGTLITLGDHSIHTSYVPMATRTDRPGSLELIGHLARANPQWSDLSGQTEAVASFVVEDAYVSPGWYPSKAVTGKVVPTWNYVVVEARGALEVVQAEAELLEMIDDLTHQHEAGRPTPWSRGDAPSEYTEALLRGIVGFRLRVRELTGAWKLDQRKSASDREGAAAGLDAEPRSRMLASLMRAVT